MQLSTKIHVGSVHRAASLQVKAGGKGLNVARALKILQTPCQNSGILAGETGKWFCDLAKNEQLDNDAWFWLANSTTTITRQTRSCLLVQSKDQDATVFNEEGPTMDAQEWHQFECFLSNMQAQVFMICGSLPLGATDLSHLVQQLVSAGKQLFIDTSKHVLADVLALPSLQNVTIKVNLQEMQEAIELLQHTKLQEEQVVLFCQQILLAQKQVRQVIMTRGKQGALYVGKDEVFSVPAPNIASKFTSSVGCGDTFHAAFVHAEQNIQKFATKRQQVQFAIACASASAMNDQPGVFLLQDAMELYNSACDN